MAFATLNGIELISLALVLPFSGIWHADMVLQSDSVVGTPQALMLDGTTYVCAPVRVTDFAGRLMIRVVGGQGGWRTPINAKQYSSPAGVPSSTVLLDAASEAGELPPVVVASVPSVLGPGWVRPAGVASLTLRQVLGDAWWLDPSGVVQTAQRAATPIASPFTVIDVHGSPGIVEVATESPGDWVPGATFSGPTQSGTISRVLHRVTGDRLRTEVMVT
jgi:hypothetical protein